MVRYVEDRFVKLKPEQQKAVIEALAAEAQLAPSAEPQTVDAGRQIIAGRECARCHQFHGKGPAGIAPDLTGYGSREWIVGMIADPAGPAFYGVRNDRMEAYLTSLARPADNLLMPRAVGAVTKWLRDDWCRPEEKDELLKLRDEKPPAQPPSVEILVDRWQRGRPAAVKVKEADLPARQLFQVEHCTVCHDYTVGGDKSIAAADPSAPDLGKYGSRQWVAGILDPKQIVTRKYFGSNPAFRTGKMAGFVRDTFADLDEEQKQEVAAIAAAVSAEAGLPSQREQDQKDAKQIEEGRRLMLDTYNCINCHTFRGRGAKTGPVLTGWGSKGWLTGLIGNPQAEGYYPKTNDGMPSYRMFPEQPGRNLLGPEQVEAIAEMIRRQE
jgi:cytochrome c2